MTETACSKKNKRKKIDKKSKRKVLSLSLSLKDKKLFYITAKYYVPIILSKIIHLIKQHFTLFYPICIPNDRDKKTLIYFVFQ